MFSSRFVSVAAFIIILSVNVFASDTPSQPPAQPPPQPALKEWTFLIFINADNNLDANGPEDINEMEKVGSTDQINVVCQMDREGADKTWRYLVQKDEDPSTVTSPIIETMDEQDMGSPDTLRDFVKWGMEKYPAKKYFVVLWNHGSGWLKNNKRFGTRGISYDDQSGNNLSVKQVGQVLHDIVSARGQKIELLGYDACLMQMGEVAAEVTETCNYQVASEETEPLDGWPYDDFLTKVAEHPEWNGAEVGKALVETFQASYNGGSQGDDSTTLSVIDLGRFAELKVASDAFTSALSANPAHREKILEAIRSSQSYAENDNKDLIDFVDHIATLITDKPVQDAAATLKSVLSEKVVLASAYTGDYVEKSKGLAVFLPTWVSASLMERYKELQWSSSTQWDEFVGVVTSAGGNAIAAVPQEGMQARNLHRQLKMKQLEGRQ